jgi:hypothetical protein
MPKRAATAAWTANMDGYDKVTALLLTAGGLKCENGFATSVSQFGSPPNAKVTVRPGSSLADSVSTVEIESGEAFFPGKDANPAGLAPNPTCGVS